MERRPPQSEHALQAWTLVTDLRDRFVAGLEKLEGGEPATRVAWLRDDGRHGGGERHGFADSRVFNRASVNVSSVHYDDEPDRRLRSATAISTIVHPNHPRVPSVHIHVSWTEMRDGSAYWRVMADLNPSIPNEADTERFAGALRAAAPEVYEEAKRQGDKYFYIPALERHRGVTHFYLEGYCTSSLDDDRALARRVGEAAIDTYLAIAGDAIASAGEPTDEDRAAQIAYHTLYLFQVLTLDRGTTSGLLIHNQNDVGILGSLPARVDRELLATWEGRVPAPQDELVRALVAALPGNTPAVVDEVVKQGLADAVRSHFQTHPDALDLQASGDLLPPTVKNHGRL